MKIVSGRLNLTPLLEWLPKLTNIVPPSYEDKTLYWKIHKVLYND